MGTIVLTGAAGGMASIYANRLAATSSEHHLILLVRDPAKVKPSLLPAPSDSIHHLGLDMCNFSAVRDISATIVTGIKIGRWPPIAALVCAAAVLIIGEDQPRITKEGYEETLAVNYLAHYILIRELLPQMAPDSRILVVGSIAHKPDNKYLSKKASYRRLTDCVQDIEKVKNDFYASGMQRYGNSKLALMMMSHELFRRLQAPLATRIQVLMLDPGSMSTGLFRNGSTFNQAVIKWSLRRTKLLRLLDPGMQASLPENSAEMLVRLTTRPEYLGVLSLNENAAPYWFASGELIKTYGAADDEGACGELWHDTAALLGYSPLLWTI